MIPVLSQNPALNPKSEQWLLELARSGFSGDIDRSYASRLAVATDNSVYQVLPDAVVFPKASTDVQLVARLLERPEYADVTAVPRGGGTGTNGQALSPGVVVDLSRHMNKILAFDAISGWVRVEPGVVLDDLNRYVRSTGWFFGPTLSPSNRATLGGMISTNASGKGSRVYGRTADHVLELEVVLLDGTLIKTCDLDLGEARDKARAPDREGQIYKTLLSVLDQYAALIEQRWPHIPRTLTGYDLKSALTNEGKRVSLNPILSGAEGTLGFIVGAKLRLLRIPQVKRTLAIAYAAFDDALAAAELLVAANPTAIETIDSRILQLARHDAIWHKVGHLLAFEVEPQAINLVEFAGEDEARLANKVTELSAELLAQAGRPSAAVGVVVTETESDALALWELRKKGVGLLGALKGERRPIPFVEDTAVPPQRLAEYVRDFRALLDEAGLIYGMFGHVDVGCLHVRPALNMRDPADEARLRKLSDAVAALVKRYGGVFWGEHGKGFRSEYVPEFFGEELFEALCRIKEAFDPKGQLNPGKLAVVRSRGQTLVSIDGPKRGAQDRQILPLAQAHFDVAIHCNGNAQCFTTDPDTIMCPSSKLRRDRVHSPKGRAAVLREWLRQLSGHGFDAGAQLSEEAKLAPDWEQSLITLGQRRKALQYDFSHEVYDALDGCLSCKACATQCPIKVDVSRMKSEFLSLYHARYARPIRDYFVALLESILVVLATLPRFFNWWMQRSWIQALMKHVVGIVDIPPLSTINLRRELNRRKAFWLTDKSLQDLRLRPETTKDCVVLLQDAFTTFYEPEVALATYDLLAAMHYRPLVVPYFANGKALVIKGFLRSFRALASRNVARLNRIAELGVPMVGIEPAVALTYREEYRELLPEGSVRFEVHLLQDWLRRDPHRLRALTSSQVSEGSTAHRRAEDSQAMNDRTTVLFGHCTERTAAPESQAGWQRIFESVGLDLQLANVGCCGMCGVFGHEALHAEESKGVYAMSWQSKIRSDSARGEVLVTGHSCRSQVHRIDGIRPKHPVEILLQHVVRS
ncbi:MAG TPA: FAD-binding and (Fe-S)-binding domain-containing protein [Polyangiaceae bacterium]